MLKLRRHLALLCSFAVVLGFARPGRAMPGIGREFALYGALHASALAFSLTPAAALSTGRKILLIAGAAFLSMLTARLGLDAITSVAGHGGPAMPVLVLAAAAALGAFAYGTLIRSLVGGRPSPRSLLAISLGCAVAACVSFIVGRRFHAAGALWLVLPWWLTFSGGLWCEERAQ
jgi:hypothetical protein